MKVLLTGGSGDLGVVLAPLLTQRGDTPVQMDIRPPSRPGGVFRHGSILDRDVLSRSLEGVDCVVHIAAWHGIHEVTGQKGPFDFWDTNMTGTFNVFETCRRAGLRRVVFISSTSVEETGTFYGFSKVLGEDMARWYVEQHQMRILTLRPRAFIPYWNRAVYASFVEWARWFWPGAVHIDDVAQAVIQSIDLLASRPPDAHLALTLDSAYEYSDADLDTWDADGPGTTFWRVYPGYYDLAIQHGLDPAIKPRRLDIRETCAWLGYEPRYSLGCLLRDLADYGAEGPPSS
jgi:nucleoside-diphosphate-sugar epimerase